MKKIILDTNFLLASYQFKIDIVAEIKKSADFSYNLFVLDKINDELAKIIDEQTGKDKEAAKWAQKIVENNKIEAIETGSDKLADDLLVEYAKEGYLVMTQDQHLKKRLLEVGAEIGILRQKKYVSFINGNPE